MTEETSKESGQTAESAADPVGVIGGDEVTPDKDDTLAWILKSLGRPSSAAVRRRAGKEAGDDAGQLFYQLFFAECSLAIRADCLTAYVASVSKLASLPKLSELIGSTHLKNTAELRAEQVRGSLMVAEPTWVLLCSGKAPIPEGTPAYCLPGDPAAPLARDHLEGWSESLQDLIESSGYDNEQVAGTRAVAALPHDVIGILGPAGTGVDGEDVFGRPLPAKGLQGKPSLGENVSEQDGKLVALEYGYVHLLEDKLSIVSPVWLAEDNSEAFWLILDQRARPVTAALIEGWLERLGVVEGVDTSAIEACVARVNDGTTAAEMATIAQGAPAKNGEDATLEVLVRTESRYGALRDDGSIDLTKAHFEPNVKADQEIARLSPATPGTPGRDLMGNTIAALDGKALTAKAGPGTRMEDGVRGFLHYYAERDGALKSVPGEVAVTDTLMIDSDVGFDTGNLEYAGEIVVKGNVGQGFTVKAGSSVFVFGSVDAGSTIVSGGDVIVGQGIAGRRTRVVARGQVRTGYIHDARVRTSSDILVGNHIVQGMLHADGVISVEQREGPRGGSISGGEIWGLSGIQMFVAGSSQHNHTSLTAGLDPDSAKKLDLLNRKLEESSKLIARHLGRFGLRKLDVKAIQQRLAASTGPQKKLLARAAQQLGEIVQIHQGLLKERTLIEESSSGGLATAFVNAEKAVFPGVVVRIGDSTREVKSPMKTSRFQLQSGVMAIR